ncbi:hypothetical protein HPP92_018954 [Vanilla planifolia]|uniref:Bromo domain-containing protein n=1 Tax=Vanilla planifolia TaxID=51239 RepID=A0A835Q7Z2_VANPL|nr:hypothetical protein HPP92_018954 [Vanilla planifolia]
MAELRREVERSDASITSLQLKLKNLRAERERNEAGSGGSDPKEKENYKVGDSPRSAPGTPARDRISCQDSGQSCKESNSTDLKDKGGQPGCKEATESVQAPESGGPASTARPVHETSYNGSSETLSLPKGVHKPEEAPPPPGDSGVSVASDAVEGAGEKDGSDVQSSVTLSRRRKGRRRKKVSDRSGVAMEAVADAISHVAANAKPIAASVPFASFFEIVRSSNYGSVFASRLESQESSRYKTLIRRHVDLQMVRARLERQGTKYSATEFFRDLLLLCNNALVFYSHDSRESTAAAYLREMVLKEIAAMLPIAILPSIDTAARVNSPPHALAVNKKLESDVENPLPKKRHSSGSLIACQKCSSLSNKAAAVGKEKRGHASDSDQKEEIQSDKQSANSKLKAAERLKISTARGFRTNKSRCGNSTTRISKLKASTISDEIVEAVPPKIDKKALAIATTLKARKRNAAGFLSRSNTERLPNSMKRSGGGSGGNEAEKKRVVKGEGRKMASRGAAAAATGSDLPAKRNVGRPPKRMALTPSRPPAKRAKGQAPSMKHPPVPAQKKRRRK